MIVPTLKRFRTPVEYREKSGIVYFYTLTVMSEVTCFRFTCSFSSQDEREKVFQTIVRHDMLTFMKASLYRDDI